MKVNRKWIKIFLFTVVDINHQLVSGLCILTLIKNRFIEDNNGSKYPAIISNDENKDFI